MAILPICKYGDPILKEKAAPIDAVDAEFAQLIEDMAATMYASNGIGLAAPQVGISRRLVVVDVDYVGEKQDGQRAPSGAGPHLRVYLNPVVTWESEDDYAMDEGCLSIPGVEGQVYRPSRVRVRWQDVHGATHEEEMEKMLGRCIQHEIDHLDGILFPDRMPFLKRTLIAGQLNKLKRETMGELAKV